MAVTSGKKHDYAVCIRWTGNRGAGTSSYRAYGREHRIEGVGKPAIDGSSTPAFRGNADRYNPEELLVAAASACHMLWYLHLCATAGVVVTSYEDAASGTMVEEADGGGRFASIVLRPKVTLAAGADRERANAFHAEAHRLCFVVNSLAVPMACEPSFADEDPPPS